MYTLWNLFLQIFDIIKSNIDKVPIRYVYSSYFIVFDNLLKRLQFSRQLTLYSFGDYLGLVF